MTTIKKNGNAIVPNLYECKAMSIFVDGNGMALQNSVSIDIYNGTVDDGKPIVRMGYLGGLPAVNGENPTGYGFYAVGNAFFSGRIVSGSGKIGGFSISDYKLVNDAGNNNVIGLCSTPNKEWAIWTGASKGGDAPFHVGHDGGLYASKATIKGSITATSGRIGNCSIENGCLVLGDTMNYANLNANTYGNYGFKLVADGNNSPWFQFNGTPQRDIRISPVGYDSYKCNGGEWFRIKFEFASTVQATTAEGYGSNTYVDINVGLYGKNTKGESVRYIPNGKRSNSTGSAQSVDTLVQLPSNVRSFSVYVQCRGSGTFSGTLKVRNVSVYRMMGNDLIVDGAITAAKIKSGEVTSDKIAANAITSDKITTNNIEGTNGWINLRSGTFKYNDGALAWDGSTMKIGGFKISKYKIINDAIGICSTAGQEWAFWAGASSGGNAPFRVGHNGSLYASNANITGTINARSLYNITVPKSFDCSSLCCTSYYYAFLKNGLTEQANYLKSHCSYTGNMLNMLNVGFEIVARNQTAHAQMQKGDLELNVTHHVAMAIDKDNIVHARSSEGTTNTIDDSGNEIRTQPWYNYSHGWTHRLRFTGKGLNLNSSTNTSTTVTKNWIEYGDRGNNVKTLQTKLNKVGYKLEINGICGNATVTAIKDFQTKYDLAVDGQAGKNTITKLDSVISAKENKNFKAFVGACTTDGTSVYQKATGATALATYPMLNRGNLVDVIGVSGSRYKIKIANAYTGYIDKAKITTPDKLTKSEYPYVGKCTGNDVAVRKDAGTSYAKISGYPTLNKDNKVDVLGVKKDSSGNEWKQVKIANKYVGYVFGKYITRV